MPTLERGKRYESLGNNISRIAYAYGFRANPVAISKKTLNDVAENADAKTAAAMALMNTNSDVKPGTQAWGVARHQRGTVIAFTIMATRQAIAQAIVVKTALSIAELSGYADLSVLISSVGDLESRKRFTRELTNFFRKHHDETTPELRQLAAHSPDIAYRTMVEKNDPLLSRAPRSMDYLSESSRKSMLATLSLFESIGIPYAMNPRLVAAPGIQSELLFAIEGTDKRGERVRVATGGRYDEHVKHVHSKAENAVAISIELPERVECEPMDEAPVCFVVHVGDAAKLKAFSVLEALWRAHVIVGQALMGESLREQMIEGGRAKTKYLAIIGQREALDGTVIVRNALTQMQSTIPLEKLTGYVAKGHQS